MVLLQGDGVRLTFDDGRPTYLRHVGDMAEFDGALSTQCELLGGPCADLNLMVSKTMTGVRAWVERLPEPRSLQPSGGTMLTFAISGVVSMAMGNGKSTDLHAWDLAVMSPGDRGAVGPPSPGESAAPLVFFATLDDNSP
jgi:environmental stress-induced protein Ves